MFVVGFQYSRCLGNPLHDVGEYETQTAEKGQLDAMLAISDHASSL